MDPNDPDELEELASQSSSEADQDEIDTPVEAGAEDAAESSTATDEPADPLAIIKEVVGEVAGLDSSPNGEEPVEAEAEAEEKPEEAHEPDNEDYTDVPFNKHPRFRELLAKSKSNEADAGRYRNVEKFLTDNAVRTDEAADALQTIALAKTNPVEAWNRIKPWVQSLASAAGAILPPDLQQRVQSGEIPLETAQELSQARAGVSSAEAQRQFEAERQSRQQAEDVRRNAMTAASSWEQDRKLRDPNFDAKLDALQREVAFLQTREGRPSDPNEVKAQLERAYKAVNAVFRAPQAPTPAPQPAKKAVRPVTGGQVAGSTTTEPRNTMDIIAAHTKVV